MRFAYPPYYIRQFSLVDALAQHADADPLEKVCEGNTTVGYYALASSAMSVKTAPIELNFSFISTGCSQLCFPNDSCLYSWFL